MQEMMIFSVWFMHNLRYGFSIDQCGAIDSV